MLITIVACVIVGAFLLNFLLPNAVRQVVNAAEASIYRATRINMDLNGDGVDGQTNGQNGFDVSGDALNGENDGAVKGAEVDGWE